MPASIGNDSRTRDYAGGGLIVLLGVGAVAQAARYRIGSLTHMGSGFFPACIGVLLVMLGVVLIAQARRSQVVDHQPGLVAANIKRQWRGWACILLSIVAFVVLGRLAGLVAASFAITFISALGDRENTLASAAMLAVAVVVIAVALFWWALQIGLPLFGAS